MVIDINVHVNNKFVKRYSDYDGTHIICPRVGEYIELPKYIADDNCNDYDNDYVEVLVTKVVHDLQRGYINVYTITEKKHR